MAVALAVDGFGQVFVTGSSEGAGTGTDYATVKYDREGEELWVSRYTEPGADWDEARALTLDLFGNAYVAGHGCAGPLGGAGGQPCLAKEYSYVTLKYPVE